MINKKRKYDRLAEALSCKQAFNVYFKDYAGNMSIKKRFASPFYEFALCFFQEIEETKYKGYYILFDVLTGLQVVRSVDLNEMLDIWNRKREQYIEFTKSEKYAKLVKDFRKVCLRK